MKPHKINTLMKSLFSLTLGTAAILSFAHGDEGHAKAKTAVPISTEEYPFGKQGDPNQVIRTIEVDMLDTMRFTPGDIKVKQGETIRFIVKNKGNAMHEMVIGTMEELKEHHAMMQKHPGMEHEEPYMAHVAPSKKETMVWQFTQPGEFYYACLIPGHFEAGMVGKIKVVKR